MVICGVGLFIDFYETYLTGIMSTVLQRDFGLTAGNTPLFLASAYLGQFFGVIAIGRLADRIGRKPAFLLNIAMFSVFSLADAIAPNATVLVAARFLAGVGMGAELILADTYLSELLPPRSRGRWIARAYTLCFVATPVAALVARFLVPLQPAGISGWRWTFALGGVVGLLLLIARRRLPESPRWLETKGRHAEAACIVAVFEQSVPSGSLPTLAEPARSAMEPATTPANPYRLMWNAHYRRRSVMLVSLNVFEAIGYYGFASLIALILQHKGFGIVSSLTFITITLLGLPLGSAFSHLVIDRFDRKWVVVATLTGMIAFGIAFGSSTNSGAIIVTGFLFNFVAVMFSNAYHVYHAEMYPAQHRAAMYGANYSLSRLATALVPFLLLPILTGYGVGPLFSTISASLLLAAASVAILGPTVRGHSLEELEDHRPSLVATRSGEH